MAAVELLNLARMTTTTTGTGTITLGSAASGFLSFAGAGAVDGHTYRYAIQDGANSEIGYGVYTSSGTTLTRNVEKSTNSNNAISLSGSAQVFSTPSATDFSAPNNIASINDGQVGGFRNAITNGAMMVAQRGTSFTSATTPANSDNTYMLDRWILLSDGNDIVDVTQSTTAPTNGLNSIGLDVETVDKKFGILQIIEQKNCIGLIGNTVTLSAQLKVTNTTRLDKIKMAIISWSSTADTVTSDIISAWGADGTNPTLVANWTYENTPSDLGVTTSWARYSVTAAVDTASTTNIGVFIWSDNVTDTDLGDFLHITDVQLEIGSVPTVFERRPFGVELALCQRYYYQINSSADFRRYGIGQAVATTSARAVTTFKVSMRIAPTFAQTGTIGNFAVTKADGTFEAITAFATATASTDELALVITVAANLVAGNATQFTSNNATGARLTFSAEL